MRVSFLTCILLLAGTVHAQELGQPKAMAIDANFSQCRGAFDEEFQAALAFTTGRHRFLGKVGWGRAGRGGKMGGIGYQLRFDPGDNLMRFEPFVQLSAFWGHNPSTPLFNNNSHTAYGLEMSSGFRYNLPLGFYLHCRTGFCMDRVDVPAYHDRIFEDKTWIKPNGAIGFGYSFQIRPYRGMFHGPDSTPPPAEDPAKHNISIVCSKAMSFIFLPSFEYRLQYAYAWRPRWEPFGGIEAATTRWFLPTEESDSVKVLGGRLGIRFFPLGRTPRISFYSDASVVLAKRIHRNFAQITPHSKNLQLEFACGLQVRIHPALRAKVAFFNRTHWDWPGNGFIRQNENGVVFGLGWQFGGRAM